MQGAVSDQGLPELHDAHASARLPVYLREIVQRRSYMWHVATNELRHRQITSVLGNVWHLLNPALSIGVYYLIFGVILKSDRGVDNFILFLTVGLFVFQFTQKGTMSGAKSIVTNKGVIKAVRFPRAMLPMSTTLTESLAFVPNFVVIVFVAVVTNEPPSIRWLAVVPLFAVQVFFTLGAAMIAARLANHFVDTIQLLPFFFRLLLYASGVLFSVDAYVASDSAYRYLFTANPMYSFITLQRWAIMGGTFRSDQLVYAILWALAIVFVGFVWFRRGEERYGRD
ncbi:teichoic acid transport system permease protein [Ilumatobacter fluminis]|uniref:Transport permease protein n=1 Tax=Ilumatobacter fluminis TaxID=467091 RepID=A0A4R7I3Y6_9ACTN|nr:ABC transporter permease [Ilumatobacter fluminis]TDT17313.1 teichoic acid transport system permease protein [Ilumatobacter fluminis]